MARPAGPLCAAARERACTAAASADFYVVWSDAFTVQNTPGALGAIGSILKTFSAYDLNAESFIMLDLDNDGSMECLACGGATSGLIDWEFVVGLDPPGGGAPADLGFALHPNPSRPGATVAYNLGALAKVEVSIYSVSGRRVRRLVDERQGAGSRELLWDGRDDAGTRPAAGTYLAELRIDGERAAARKSVLIR